MDDSSYFPAYVDNSLVTIAIPAEVREILARTSNVSWPEDHPHYHREPPVTLANIKNYRVGETVEFTCDEINYGYMFVLGVDEFYYLDVLACPGDYPITNKSAFERGKALLLSGQSMFHSQYITLVLVWVGHHHDHQRATTKVF